MTSGKMAAAVTKPTPDKKKGTSVYQVLEENGALETKYLVKNFNDIPTVESNLKTQEEYISKQVGSFAFCVVGGVVWNLLNTFLEVNNANVVPAEDGQGNYFLYGPGLHHISDPFIKMQDEVGLGGSNLHLSHGTITIVVIPEGQAGYAEDRGEPIIIPQGMHYWNSPTMKFMRIIPTDEHIVYLGPMTLLTIDEGYVAVSQNNGKQVILDGGMVHLLTHRNWKFQKLVPLKQETIPLDNLTTCTRDFIQADISATCTWRIADPEKTCLFSVQTMTADGSNVVGDDIVKIRHNVKMQAVASLVYVIANSNFIADNSLKNAKKSTWLDSRRLQLAAEHASSRTQTYGAEVMTIGIINMNVKSRILEDAFSGIASATAQATQAQFAAEGQASAIRITAQATAGAMRLEARGHFEAAEELAKTSSGSELAFDLARIEAAGAMFNPEKHQIIFGDASQGELTRQMLYPDMLTAVMCNPKLVYQHNYALPEEPASLPPYY